MNAKYRGYGGRAVLTGLLLLAGGATLAEKPGQDGESRKDAGPGRAQQGEWRNYYQEREQREERYKREKSQQDRAWQEYNRERQRRGYRSEAAPEGTSVEIRIGGYFGYPQRAEVQQYYRERARRGFCPPGLAKKGNGCQPPGQARVWVVGQPLPPDVAYYPVEPAVRVRLGLPPPGHEFVRIASDILLIAVGTGMVIDAIEDLGR